ncbi:MAG: hypothetical protein JEZ02_18720 [Desulfatibacillum sp.]|nr:hypothetical protein [Desulfatibacillum sp.]
MENCISEDLKLEMKQIMDSDLKDPTTVALGEDSFHDAVGLHLDRASKANERLYNGQLPMRLEDHIYGRLGQIPLRPKKNQDSRQALINCYCYKNLAGDPDQHIVNKNPASTEKFGKDLVETARSSRFLTDMSSNSLESMSKQIVQGAQSFILHGPRGSGKTFYLNHLFAKFEGVFDKRKVIWVRVNLLHYFCDKMNSENLLEWIFGQLTKIVYRYYYPDSQLFEKRNAPNVVIDPHAILSNYIKSDVKSATRKDHYEDKIQGFLDMFIHRDHCQSIVKDTIPLNLGRALFTNLLKKGFGFIFVLDGLDRLQALPHLNDRWLATIEGLKQILVGETPLQAAFLLVTRTQNIPIVRDTVSSLSQGVGADLAKIERKLVAVDFEHVLQKRLEYIQEEISNIPIEALDPSRDIEPKQFSDFIGLLTPLDARKDSFWQQLQNTSIIFKDNLRAKMQTLQCIYYQFIRDKIGRKYRLVETLLLAGREFPPSPFRYSLEKNCIVRRNGDLVFDNVFLPNIFLFPICNEIRDKGPCFKGNKFPLLAGLRLLQILQCHQERESVKTGTVSLLNVRDLIKILSTLFDYNRSHIENIVEEFVEYELLHAGGIGYDCPDCTLDYQPRAMPKARYILQEMLYEISYFGLCALRIPLHHGCLVESPPYVKCFPIDKPHYRKWNRAKILNAIALTKIVSHMNRAEEKLYAKNINKIEGRLKAIVERAQIENSMFGFIGKASNCFVEQAQKLLSESESEGALFETELRKYKKRWS